MSKHAKTLQKLTLLPTPSNVKWDELKSALESLGYKLQEGDGSRVKFVHSTTKDVISLHRPHPNPEVKRYVIRSIVEQLRSNGYL